MAISHLGRYEDPQLSPSFCFDIIVVLIHHFVNPLYLLWSPGVSAEDKCGSI